MHEHNRKPRKSGLKEAKDILKEEDSFADFDVFLRPYINVQKEYAKILQMHKHRIAEKVFLVTYVGIPDIMYIAFATNRDKARGIATKYFRDNFHPMFINNGWRTAHTQGRGIRCPQLDKYIPLKKIPVQEILKLKPEITVPCRVCGQGDFNSKSIENKACFVLDEEDLNVFTKGIIVCRDCFKKHFEPNLETS